MELVIPSAAYKDSYIEALKDGFCLGSNPPKTPAEIQEIEADFEGFVTKKILKLYNPTPRLREDGKYHQDSPQISYWLIDKGNFIGVFNLRTQLNEFLMYINGNVGYGITPKYRRQGYATRGLALLKEKAKALKMEKLLVAAKESNIGSWKAIEKNGGVLENIIYVPWDKDGERYKRYWITLV